MFNTAPIAAAFALTTEELDHRIAQQGWDFSKLSAADMASVRFVADTVAGIASDLAAGKAKRAAQIAKAEAERVASITAAARKNPELSCTRCAGKGTIRGFGHVEKGVCFACNGKGIRHARRCA